MPLVNMIPQRILLKLNPGMSTFVEFKQVNPIKHIPRSRRDVVTNIISQRNCWGIWIGRISGTVG